jgi:hypothetical protein
LFSAEGNPQPRASWKLDSRPHDTNHGVAGPVQADLAPDDSHIGPKLVTPHAVGENHHRCSADLLIRADEIAPQHRVYAQHAEEVMRDRRALNLHRLGFSNLQNPRVAVERSRHHGNILKVANALLKVAQFGISQFPNLILRQPVGLPDDLNRLLFRKGQRPQ